ncbi:MAG TPA: hypothetical protein VK629_05180 [Steroidobacteraceae bacterium]|nr:hypothetical protein [Steroidobacteraceae bacterium]
MNKALKLRIGAWIGVVLVLGGCGGGASSEPSVGVVTGGGSPTAPPPSNPPSGEPDAPPAPTEVGSPIAPAVSAVIGAGGGSVTSQDGALTIEVPAGAFANDRTVSIQEITNKAHGANGRAFRISPEGLNTSKPMTVRFKYTDSDLLGTALPFISIAYQDANKFWRVYKAPVVNTAERTLAVETNHFSDWSMVTGVQLLPKQARVRTGDSLELLVVHCESELVDDGDDDLIIPLVIHECKPSPLNALASRNWSVNGAVGGSGRFGTIVANTDRTSGKAVFTAPATKPTPSVVSVSAQHELLDGLELLVSNITIDDQLVDCAALKNVQRFNAELSFDEFSFNATAEDLRHTGTHAGMLRGNLQRVHVGPDFGLWFTYQSPLTGGHVYINDAYEFTPPSGDGYSGTINAHGTPHDDIHLPSFIGLKVDFATCTFDLFGSFIADGTSSREGVVSNNTFGIGGLYLFGQPITIEQGASLLLHGSLAVNARDDIQQTGYSPLEPVATQWEISGGTTARWRIEAAQ